MNKVINIAIVGLGQIGIYLYNELIQKKKEIEIKTGKKINKRKNKQNHKRHRKKKKKKKKKTKKKKKRKKNKN